MVISLQRLKYVSLIMFLALVSQSFSVSAFNTVITIDPAQNKQPISPGIYGTNQVLTGTENFSGYRLGGNRMTGYNWENNASNAGSDYIHSSDNYMTSVFKIPNSQANVPGIVQTAFIDSCRKWSQFALTTFQMAGYVARDKSGAVDSSQTAPSARWRELIAHKSTAFSTLPDTSDNAVYMDELLNFLETKYAAASNNWLGGICLDNEPALWSSTHPRIHPAKPTCTELLNKSVALSTAIKAIDTKPLIFGPVAYGFAELSNFQSATDWNSVKGSASWFVDWYLSSFKTASQTAGVRLLDVFDLHWYPEAQGNGERIVFNQNPTNRANAEARVQAPRTLWDAHYKETSWIAQNNASFLPLIPKVKASIEANYPGTKLGISEYCYGAENHISGGLAMVDVLGIFGKYGVDYAFYWKLDNQTTYTSAAFKLYRNFDGNKATFGNTSVSASTTDSVSSSVYASIVSSSNSELHVILLNKNYDSTMTAAFTITSQLKYESAKVWSFDSTSATIKERLPAPVISNNAFTYAIPKLTACHIVLTSSSAVVPRSMMMSNSAKVFYTNGLIHYRFLPGQSGSISLYGLNGATLQIWNSVNGSGALRIGKIGKDKVALIVWNSGNQSERSRIILAR